jgi:transcriptional regulator with XRE-family HTH domain
MQTTDTPVVKPYASLADYMERTGINTTRLHKKLIKRKVPISATHLGNVLKGRYTPSLYLAVRISEVTGVAVEKLLLNRKKGRRKQIEQPLKSTTVRQVARSESELYPPYTES